MILRILKWIGIGIVLLLIGIGLFLFIYARRNTTYFKQYMDKVENAGYVEKVFNIHADRISYLEGPINGPPLLLIHGQMTDKYNWAPLLPALAENFWVFAVDCYGHGQSTHNPEKYSNVAHGEDFLSFIEENIHEPLLVAGHSSGGYIATWLAAYGQAYVKGALFEDPPFFTLSLPRARSTWNWVDLATNAHDYLASPSKDWVWFQVEHSRIWKFFGDSRHSFLAQAEKFHSENPTKAISWVWLPPEMNESFRSVPDYDPRFGDVFYHGKWEAGFDLESALNSINIPVIYQKSKAELDDSGILMGATSDLEAQKAVSLLENVLYYEDDKNHSWHWSDPGEAIQRLLELKELAEL